LRLRAASHLIAGLWTPIIGTLLALDELWIALSLYLSPQADIVIPITGGALRQCGDALPWRLVNRRSPVREKALL
jgi:hypothetical protein